MSQLSSHILKVAMCASPDSPVTALVAVPSDVKDSPLNKAIWVTFPLEGLPATSHISSIPTNETYLEELRRHISARGTERLIIVPPYVPHSFLPSSLREQFPRLNYDEIVFQLVAEWLPPGTSVGMIQPATFLQSKSSRNHRATLFEVVTPKLLVTNLLSYVGASLHLPMALLVVEKNSPNKLLRFFKCPEESDQLNLEVVTNDLSRLLKKEGGKTNYGYIVREGLPPDAPLVHALYDPALVDQMKDLMELGQLKRLADFSEMVRTGYPAARYSKESLKGGSVEGVALVQGANIGSHNWIQLDENHQRICVSPDQLLVEGDLCIPSICRLGQNLRVAEVTKGKLPLAAGTTVIVIRLKPELTLEERQTLIAYLRSPRSAARLKLFESTLKGDLRITPGSLSELPIPLLDEALQAALSEINESIRHFQEWSAQAETARNALFEFAKPKEDRLQLLSTGRLSRQRCESAKLVTNLRHRIRTQFPHPIAFRWRTVESSWPNLEGYQNVLECSEVAVCYLACMAFLIGRALPDFKISYFAEIAKRMNGDNPHGTNMGDWAAVIREVRDSKNIRNVSKLIPFSEIALIDAEADKALQKLLDYRNDFAHGRGPKGAKIKKCFEESRDCLESFLEGVEFITEYPLRYVEKAKRDSLSQCTEYHFRELTGDHPLVPLVTATTEMAEVEEESLYLADRNGNLFLLRPLLNFLECPECGRMSVFYLDKYQKGKKKSENKCVLKSMENGHTTDGRNLVSAFQKIGLLPQP